ncbi:MAG TPA: nucleotide exchange factor GrpE [Thermoleophilaceae bacterium]
MIEEQQPVTQQPESGEPSGEQDPKVEQEILEATEDATGDEGSAEEADPQSAIAAERDKYLDLAQRTQADFENYRKRAAKDAANAGERAKAGLVRELLPVLDNLERALATAVHDDGDASPVVEGVRLVRADLLGVLERSGVQAFDPAGEPFDPTVHEALSTRPADEGTHPGTVVDVVEKGYRLNDTVLRPARVVVSQ